jgi:DNA-binding response OmpR family regulator
VATHRVLVVDDDPDIRTVVAAAYRRADFEVLTVADGGAAMAELHRTPIDLVVLDMGLPDRDGMAVLREIRDRTDVPVLFLTARTDEDAKVHALMRGADDYVTKPFSNRELVARSLAVLRRVPHAAPVQRIIDDGIVRVDVGELRVEVDGRSVALTPIEWNLLLAFVEHPDVVLSTQQLLELAWRDPLGIGPDRVKYGVLRLRRVIASASSADGKGRNEQSINRTRLSRSSLWSTRTRCSLMVAWASHTPPMVRKLVA